MGFVAIPKKPVLKFNENGFDILIVIENDNAVYIEKYLENDETLISRSPISTNLIGFLQQLGTVVSELNL
jgi:hypothetical protein